MNWHKYFPPKFGFPWEGKGPFKHWEVAQVTAKPLCLTDPINIVLKPSKDEKAETGKD